MAESPERSTFIPPHHERQAAHSRANRSDKSREQARQRWQPLIPPNWPPPESAAPRPDPAALREERDRPPKGRATPPRSAPPPRGDPGFQWPDPQRPVPRRPLPPEPPVRERAPDASGWHWLLWLPIIVPL